MPVILEGDLTPELTRKFLSGTDIGVDLEMMGLNPLRDRLCLVQITNRAGVSVFVKSPKRPCPNLRTLFEDEKVQKVFHFARMDIGFLLHHLGIRVKRIFCTRTASKLVRTYTEAHGLKDVVQELLGIQLDKTVKHTDWASDVLSEQQIKYALQDAAVMIPLKDCLVPMLEREGRSELAEKCFEVIPVMAELDLLGFERLFEHH
ncbi:MAG: ribonuclease D [Acidobacteria bacterium]|nr:ribonuclease D [Acidobacteriota bacterium]